MSQWQEQGIWKKPWFDARVRGVCPAFPGNLGIAVLHHPSWLQKLLLSFKISLVLFSLSPQSLSSLCWTVPRSIFSTPFDSHMCYKICGLCSVWVSLERPHVMAHLLVAFPEKISLCLPWHVPIHLRLNLVCLSLNVSETWTQTKAQAEESLDCTVDIFILLWVDEFVAFLMMFGWCLNGAEVADCPKPWDCSRMSWEPAHPGERGTWQAPCPIS